MKDRNSLIEKTITEDKDILLWEFLNLTEALKRKTHENKTCKKIHKKWNHKEWADRLKIPNPNNYKKYNYFNPAKTDELDVAKKIADLLYDIEVEIEKYYINRNGNKYHKLSEFYNWFTNEKKLNLNTKLNQEFPSNQSIESLIDSIDL